MNKTIEEAQAKLDAANAALLNELQQDSTRSEGSSEQERRRDEHRQRLEKEVERCTHTLELAKKSAPSTKQK